MSIRSVRILAAMFLLGSLSSAAEEKAELAFRPGENGEYLFDTGILRGVLQPGGKAQGLASVVHVPSGMRLDAGAGILSFYRIFTTDKRYGAMAWDWPSTSKLLPDGAVEVSRPAEPGRPFELIAVYRWSGPAMLDLEITVKAHEDLDDFEVFLASYFDKTLASPYVYVAAGPEGEGQPGFVLATKSDGDWQLFPRDDKVLAIVHDGRWTKEPYPLNWAIRPPLAAPLCFRRSADMSLAVAILSPATDCFAISTPYEGETHYSLYPSLFGRDVKAGRNATARARFVVTTKTSDRDILSLYQDYVRGPVGR
ncbi:MAG TPA: hypothetical protein PLU87_18495 [Sedimentisphaerales bacterium]|nr:hypothetical protein [Sedimentisphaerales bacterium]HRS13073.1 hypothetical protein [Sedimentisphaerales bacterium]HRV49653.1 hypothetical protein [Sedimentisphaerales bacterium]